MPQRLLHVGNGQAILQVGGVWLTQGKVKASLPYLVNIRPDSAWRTTS
mgnify:CR=1 FL=1